MFSDTETVLPYLSFFFSLFNRKRQTNGERQSLNTKQTSRPACPSWTSHLWTLVVLTKNSMWTLARSASNKWTPPKLKTNKQKSNLKNTILSLPFLLFLVELSWILPFLLHMYLLYIVGEIEAGSIRALCNMISWTLSLTPPPHQDLEFFFFQNSYTVCGKCQPL